LHQIQLKYSEKYFWSGTPTISAIKLIITTYRTVNMKRTTCS